MCSSDLQNLWPFLPGAKHRHEIHLRGACDGFLAVTWRCQFYICNPVTREHALLPQPHQLYQDMIGFAELMENNIVGFYPVAELAQVQSLGTRPKPIRERKWTCVAQQKDNTREEKRRGHVSKISPNRQSNLSSSTQITISDSLLL